MLHGMLNVLMMGPDGGKEEKKGWAEARSPNILHAHNSNTFLA